MRRIARILTPERVRDLKATSKDEALAEMSSLVADAPEVTCPREFLSAIRSREELMSTGIGSGIAIPHSKTSSLTDFVMAVGRVKEGLDFDSLDGLPVQIIILVGSSDTQAEEFLKVLANVGAFFNIEENKRRFLSAETSDDMYRVIVGNH